MNNRSQDRNSCETIRKWLEGATSELKNAGIMSARLDSLLLLEFTLQKSRSWLLAHEDELLDEEAELSLNNYLVQRKNHTPLPYITGTKEFYGREFKVNNNVLIPRPESEAIIDLVTDAAKSIYIGSEMPRSVTLLDLGTGSGCLAISAKLELPELKVLASDISGSALKVARLNASLLNAEINFVKSDLMANLHECLVDILVANLPYVPGSLITSKEILAEPSQALFSGKTGLNHYIRFWSEISKLEYRPIFIITESLYEQHESIELLAKENGYLLNRSKDLIQVFKKY